MADSVRIQLKITAPTTYSVPPTSVAGLQTITSGTRVVYKFESDFTKTIDPAAFPEVVSVEVSPDPSSTGQYTGYSDGDLLIFSNPATEGAVKLLVDDGGFPPTQFCIIGPGESTFIIAKSGTPPKYYYQAETVATTLNIIRFESV